MSDNIASDFARLLAANGFGSIASPSPTIVSNVLPHTPDNLIAVYVRPGEGAEDTFGGTDHGVFGLQTIIRDLGQNTACTKAKNVWLFLHRFKGTVEGVPIKVVWAKGVPIPLGQDENSRWQWSNNFTVRRQL